MSRMPVLFVGHGSPMNAIDNNEFTAQWEKLAEKIPRPQAILSISAHWFTKGSRIMDSIKPATIYDLYGFPDELYKVVYNAPGAPKVAQQTKSLLQNVEIDNTWGFDHGTWSVLCRAYPDADIPVFQLSVDRTASLEDYYDIGRQLQPLRDDGVLILGSGNVVHNLSLLRWNMEGGFPWAEDFDNYIKEHILAGNHQKVIDYKQAGLAATQAFAIYDHFAPLLYVLGATDHKEQVAVFNHACLLGSISMTSYLCG